jgi:hypothetical protein
MSQPPSQTSYSQPARATVQSYPNEANDGRVSLSPGVCRGACDGSLPSQDPLGDDDPSLGILSPLFCVLGPLATLRGPWNVSIELFTDQSIGVAYKLTPKSFVSGKPFDTPPHVSSLEPNALGDGKPGDFRGGTVARRGGFGPHQAMTNSLQVVSYMTRPPENDTDGHDR